METFIVRVYQRDSNEPWKIAGAVEIPGKEFLIRFDSEKSLHRILAVPIFGDRKNGHNDGN